MPIPDKFTKKLNKCLVFPKKALYLQCKTNTTMAHELTYATLAKVCKTKNVNLDWYDSVFAYINEAYTKVYITLASMEVVGGSRRFCNQTTLTLSVSAIMKRYSKMDAPADEPMEWQYTTNGWAHIFDLKK